VLKEFKEFANARQCHGFGGRRDHWAAFGKIVTSLVEDVLMPPIGQLVGKVDFAGLFINLGGRHFDSLTAAKAATPPGPTLKLTDFHQ